MNSSSMVPLCAEEYVYIYIYICAYMCVSMYVYAYAYVRLWYAIRSSRGVVWGGEVLSHLCTEQNFVRTLGASRNQLDLLYTPLVFLLRTYQKAWVNRV